ncbi:winged helix-turn-helix transcriptional regulator [Enterococcus faecalis]
MKLSINLIFTIDKLKILFGEQNYEKNPPHVEYKLIKLGNTLLPVIESMREWGEFYKTQVNI